MPVLDPCSIQDVDMSETWEVLHNDNLCLPHAVTTWKDVVLANENHPWAYTHYSTPKVQFTTPEPGCMYLSQYIDPQSAAGTWFNLSMSCSVTPSFSSPPSMLSSKCTARAVDDNDVTVLDLDMKETSRLHDSHQTVPKYHGRTFRRDMFIPECHQFEVKHRVIAHFDYKLNTKTYRYSDLDTYLRYPREMYKHFDEIGKLLSEQGVINRCFYSPSSLQHIFYIDMPLTHTITTKFKRRQPRKTKDPFEGKVRWGSHFYEADNIYRMLNTNTFQVWGSLENSKQGNEIPGVTSLDVFFKQKKSGISRKKRGKATEKNHTFHWVTPQHIKHICLKAEDPQLVQMTYNQFEKYKELKDCQSKPEHSLTFITNSGNLGYVISFRLWFYNISNRRWVQIGNVHSGNSNEKDWRVIDIGNIWPEASIYTNRIRIEPVRTFGSGAYVVAIGKDAAKSGKGNDPNDQYVQDAEKEEKETVRYTISSQKPEELKNVTLFAYSYNKWKEDKSQKKKKSKLLHQALNDFSLSKYDQKALSLDYDEV